MSNNKLIFIAILQLVTLLSAAPHPTRDKPNPLDDERFSVFKDTLVNKEKLQFLKECYEPQNHLIVCPLYTYMLDNLLTSQIPSDIKSDEIDKTVVDIPGESEQFCANLRASLDKLPEALNNTDLKPMKAPMPCTFQCITTSDGINYTVKPICKLLNYGFLKIVQNFAIKDATTTVKVNPAALKGFDTNIMQKPVNSTTTAIGIDSKPHTIASTVPVLQPHIIKPEVPKVEELPQTDNTPPKIETKVNDQSITTKSTPNISTAVNGNDQSAASAPAQPQLSQTQSQPPAETPVKSKITAAPPAPVSKPKDSTNEINLDQKIDNTPDDSVKQQTDLRSGYSDLESNMNQQTDINLFNDPEEEGQLEDDSYDEIAQSEHTNIQHVEKKPQVKMPEDESESYRREQIDPNTYFDDNDSNFFSYFLFLMLVCIVCYVVYHNKTKVLALVLEGRRSSTSNGRGGPRRKHTAAYRKLDSNLEEAITSTHTTNRVTQIIY